MRKPLYVGTPAGLPGRHIRHGKQAVLWGKLIIIIGASDRSLGAFTYNLAELSQHFCEWSYRCSHHKPVRKRRHGEVNSYVCHMTRNLAGSQARPTLSILKQQQQQLCQNNTKDCGTTGPMYEQVLHRPVSQKKSSDSASEESHLHYADIHVLSQMQPYSSKQVKHRHVDTATEYATLRFPQATPRYDSNHGTLV